jgi:hypothetical protein
MSWSHCPGADNLHCIWTDLQTANVAYYKVGRTENVPRRLDEWKKRKWLVHAPTIDGGPDFLLLSGCSSHHPTLRDVFPLNDGDGPGQSMLPGAMQGGIQADLVARKTSPAVKRLEREGEINCHFSLDTMLIPTYFSGLIHIELAAHAAKTNHGRQRYACPDCQTFHQVRQCACPCRIIASPVLS